MLAVHSVVCAEKFAVDFNTSIYHRTCSDPLEVLNRYWRAQLSDVKVLDLTAAARHAHEALTFSVDHSIWLQNFNRFVIPLILRFELPRI